MHNSSSGEKVPGWSAAPAVSGNSRLSLVVEIKESAKRIDNSVLEKTEEFFCLFQKPGAVARLRDPFAARGVDGKGCHTYAHPILPLVVVTATANA